MDIRPNYLVIFALLLAAPAAMSQSPKPLEDSVSPANSAFLAGLWSLTTQPQAITLADLTTKLHIDLHDYKVDGGPKNYELSALDGDQARRKSHAPIRALTLGTVAAFPGAQGNQELRMYLGGDVCISTRSVAPYADSSVMTAWVPCTDGAACASEITYFYAAGKTLADKRRAIGSQLQVARECSQGVVIAKSFDKDYWLALCPFSYNKQLHDNVITVVKEKYPAIYASFDLEQPRITDYGGATMQLNFREPASAPRLALLSMEVDRCDLTIIRSWLPMKHSHK
jgi:hypothetical protein